MSLAAISYLPVPPYLPVSQGCASPEPHLCHLEEKRYLLDIVNAQRARAGLGSVALGDNAAAQLHAESALENCFSSHWGLDGLKPYMRYTLAGGYQSNAENVSGLDYCAHPLEQGRPLLYDIEQDIREAMAGWMESPGHRDNILDPWHRKMNVGLAWNRHNTMLVQHFEGDYVEFDQLPAIDNGVLSLSGRTKHGVIFRAKGDLGVQVHYDRPPHSLAAGQLARTYCYGSGRQIAALRPPLTGRRYYPERTFTASHRPCPDPYSVPRDAPAPRSAAEAHRYWQDAYNASRNPDRVKTTVPWITASQWRARGRNFALSANLGEVLRRHGEGVYTVTLWGAMAGGQEAVIARYSLFHGTIPPSAYGRIR